MKKFIIVPAEQPRQCQVHNLTCRYYGDRDRGRDRNGGDLLCTHPDTVPGRDYCREELCQIHLTEEDYLTYLALKLKGSKS